MKTQARAMHQTKESPIDERYRLLLLRQYLRNSNEVPMSSVSSKWIFACPFCSHLGRTESKRNERKGVLLWNNLQYSWVFSCARKGSVDCLSGKTLGNFITALNPTLGDEYKRERWHSGTTGKGHNCEAPKNITQVSTGNYGSSRENIVVN